MIVFSVLDSTRQAIADAGYDRMQVVARHGEDGFDVMAWDSRKPDTKFIWDTATNRIQQYPANVQAIKHD